MTKNILISVILGMTFSYFFIPENINVNELSIDTGSLLGNIIVAGLCLLLLFVGIDIGYEGTVIKNLKKVGTRVLVFPFASIAGSLLMAFVASFILPMSWNESLAVGAGLGWYTLAPAIIMNHSPFVGTVSFIHNLMRELLGIILMPLVAKKLGYLEAMSLPGSASMDVCLPIVEKVTSGDIVVYSFITGAVMSMAVPVLVPLFIAI